MSYPGAPYYPPEFDPRIPVTRFDRLRTRRAPMGDARDSHLHLLELHVRVVFAIVDGEPQTQLSHGRVIGECMGA